MEFLRLTHPHTGDSIAFVPSLGGTVVSLSLGHGPYQVLENDSADEILDNPLFRGRFLFPFNDRIPGGTYNFNGTEYRLPVNSSEDGSAIHGFLYNKEVEVKKTGETEAVLYWRTGKDVFPGYPFDLSLRIVVSLRLPGVVFTFTVKNEGEITAPFALGWHSYFKTDPASVIRAGYPCYFETDYQFLPVGSCRSVEGSDFDFSNGRVIFGRNLDHTFKTSPEGVTILENRNYRIRIKQQNFKYTQLFIPPERTSVAIEPITSKPNSFNTDEVLILHSKEEYSADIEISIL